jgi:hypothetical protein
MCSDYINKTDSVLSAQRDVSLDAFMSDAIYFTYVLCIHRLGKQRRGTTL